MSVGVGVEQETAAPVLFHIIVAASGTVVGEAGSQKEACIGRPKFWSVHVGAPGRLVVRRAVGIRVAW